MPKGYWIASLDVTDVDAYKRYVEANAEAFAKYEGKFLTRGGEFTRLEGNRNRSRNCIVEFKDVDTALACYWSPEYQRALELRKGIADADIIIMAGYDGPQPPEQPGERANVHLVQAGDSVVYSVERGRQLPQWVHRAMLSDGTILTQEQYDDLTAACQS